LTRKVVGVFVRFRAAQLSVEVSSTLADLGNLKGPEWGKIPWRTERTLLAYKDSKVRGRCVGLIVS
jgi:hypothetical protein